MKTYLNSLNDREKWMVIGAGLCLLAYIYCFFLYAPVKNMATQRQEQLTEKTQTLAWMKQVSPQGLAETSRKTLDNSQLLTVISRQLKEQSRIHNAFQLQQTASGDVELVFEAVPFQLFMQWLDKMNRQYTFNIKQFSATRSKTPGVAKVMVIVSA